MSSIPSLTLNQLVSGFSIASAQFQQGQPSGAILDGIRAFLPPPESEWTHAVEPLQTLSVANGGQETEVAPHVLAGAFFESARRLQDITQESHPHISVWADGARQFWRRRLSQPPVVESQALAVNLQNDEALLIAWLRQFIEFSPQPMGVVRCHADGAAELVLLNKINRERWGLSESDLTGVSVLRFFYPEDHEMVRAFIRECLERGNATHTGARMLRRTGGHLPVDMYVGRVDDTKYAYFQVIDETEREEALEQARIRDIVFRNAQMPLLMLSFDGSSPSGMVTSAGFDRMLGYAPGEIGMKPVIDFIPKHLRPEFGERLKKFLSTGTLSWSAVELTAKDGSTVLVDIEARDSGVKDKRFAIVSFSDARIRIKAEETIAATERLASAKETAAHIAHNLNNMLTIIFGGLQLMAVQNPDDGFLASMMTNAEMMARMTNRIRQMNDTVEGEVDVHSLLDPAMIRLIAPKIREVEIALELTESPWRVPGPNDVVWEFVHNVIKNAMEAMENVSTRQLTIATENVEIMGASGLRRLDPDNRFPAARPGRFLQLTIRDTGSGIPPETLARIFDDYFSTKGETQVRRGRGLKATQNAIANRGGLLTVRSVVGSGTTFEIYLPRMEDETAKDAASEQPVATASSMLDQRWMSRGDEIVLVADDDEAIRDQFAKILLKYYGYKEVLFATTTQETLKIVSDRPDLTAIVMDWRMPGDTSDILLGDLRDLRPKIPILVNTGLVPDHKHLYPDVQFTPKLRGMTKVARAVRLLIDGKPID